MTDENKKLLTLLRCARDCELPEDFHYPATKLSFGYPYSNTLICVGKLTDCGKDRLFRLEAECDEKLRKKFFDTSETLEKMATQQPVESKKQDPCLRVPIVLGDYIREQRFGIKLDCEFASASDALDYLVAVESRTIQIPKLKVFDL